MKSCLAGKWRIVIILGLLLFIPTQILAIPITVTFDDLAETGFTPIGSFIPDRYAGFNWNNFGVIDPLLLGEPFETSGYTNGIVSGSYVGFIPGEGSEVTYGGGTFHFQSAYLTGAWKDQVRVLVTGYEDNTVLYQDILFVDSDVPTFIGFNYLGIDSLQISSSGGVDAGYGGFGSQVAFDNISFSVPFAVPEPMTLALFGIGIVSVIIFGKKRHRKWGLKSNGTKTYAKKY